MTGGQKQVLATRSAVRVENTGLRIAEAATRDASDAALYPAKLRQRIFQETLGKDFFVAA